MRYHPSIRSINAESAEIEHSSKLQQHDRSKSQPETVNCTVFRDVLLEGLPGGVVSYGKWIGRFENTSSGLRSVFTDGSHAEGALLVGTDGTRSSVRQQYIRHIEIVDPEIRCIYGQTPLTPGLVQSLQPEIMGGMSGVRIALGNTSFLWTYRIPQSRSSGEGGVCLFTGPPLLRNSGQAASHGPHMPREGRSHSWRV